MPLKYLLLVLFCLLQSGCAYFYKSQHSNDYKIPPEMVGKKIKFSLTGTHPDGKSFSDKPLNINSLLYISRNIENSLESEICRSDDCKGDILITIHENLTSEFPESARTNQTWSTLSMFTLGIIPYWSKINSEITCEIQDGKSSKSFAYSYKLYTAIHTLLFPFGIYWFYIQQLNQVESGNNRVLADSIKKCVSDFYSADPKSNLNGRMD